MDVLSVTMKERYPGIFTIALDGPLDTSTYGTFDYYMERISKDTTKEIILDMSKVNYISSMGVGSLFKVRKFAKENQVKFLLAGLQPHVKKVLDTVQALPPEAVFKDIKELDDYLLSIQKKRDEE